MPGVQQRTPGITAAAAAPGASITVMPYRARPPTVRGLLYIAHQEARECESADAPVRLVRLVEVDISAYQL